MKYRKEKNTSNGMDTQALKQLYASELRTAINNTDINMEYRTRFCNYGSKFHDRFLILKFNQNKTRAWSLGISVNQLGASHHVIQIVEQPTAVSDMFDEMWNDMENADCLIYKQLGKSIVLGG